MRLNKRVALIAAVVAAVVVPAAANAATLLTVTNPTNGCKTSVYGPDVQIHTLPNPGVSKSGGVGESVNCS